MNFKENDFYQYKAGMSLSDFPIDKVPLLQMEHLRQMDFVISRGVSFERTAYDFLSQIELNDSLNCFKNYDNIVVLLDREGAMIKYDKVWYIIFTADKQEVLTLKEDEDLYPVYKEILKSLQNNEKCIIHLDKLSRKVLLNRVSSLNFLDYYCKNYPGGYLAVAEKIVIDGPETLYKNVPVTRYDGLTAVDLEERESYDAIVGLMSDYIQSVDSTKGESIRPLSVCVFGAPGSGKSFGVKQIAKSFGRFDIFTLNLSQFDSYDEMLISLDNALRDSRDIPLIFFDEFDSDYKGTKRGWLKFLLSPMQDGEYLLGSKTIKIEKAVFVFAGGTASTFREFLPSNVEEEEEFKTVKGPDFVSRLSGTLNVKGPNPTAVNDRAYIIRRALLFRNLIIRKNPSIYDEETGKIRISEALLSALLRTSIYRHGTRSLEFILDMSRLKEAERFTPSCLPLPNQLDIHLDRNDFNAKLAAQRVSEETVRELTQFAYEVNVSQRLALATKNGVTDSGIRELMKEDRMQPWENLLEEYKEEYCSCTRKVIEGMESYYFPIGIRPKSQLKADTITDLFGAKLDYIAALYHDVTCTIMLKKGWRFGEKADFDLLISPKIIKYDELSLENKEEIQMYVREFPKLFKKVGLEMYEKAYVKKSE